MKTKLFALLSFIIELTIASDNMARDYFMYKNVSSIVFFSCGNVTSNYHFMSLLNKESISVTIVHPEWKYSHETAMRLKYWQLGVILDLGCKNDYKQFVVMESSKYGMYNGSYSWLVFGSTLNETKNLLSAATLGVDTNFVIAIPTQRGYDLYDVFNYAKTSDEPLNVIKFAYWQKDSGLSINSVRTKYQRRANFQGMKLKVISITQYRPNGTSVLEFLQDYKTRHLDSMTKLGFAIFSHIADIFNFTMEIIETELWDQTTSDGSHFGMIGMLNHSEGDFGSSPAIMFSERTHLCDLIGPVWPFRTCFMLRSTASKVTNEFFEPLDRESWIATTFVTALCIIILAIAMKFEYIRDNIAGWEIGVLSTIGIMCQQGSSFAPKYLSGRMVFLQSLIFSLLIYNYYSASIVSARLNQPMDKMNDSLHQLTISNFRIASEPITYTNYGLTRLNDWEVREFYLKRWKPLSDDERFVSLDEGFDRVSKGGFAYHTDPNTGYPYVERLFTNQMICELTEIHLYRPQQAALWASRRSPFTKMARIALTKITETGLLSRQVKRWASRKPICFREIFAVRSITILEVAPAFFILSSGIIIGLIICILENIIAKFQD